MKDIKKSETKVEVTDDDLDASNIIKRLNERKEEAVFLRLRSVSEKEYEFKSNCAYQNHTDFSKMIYTQMTEREYFAIAVLEASLNYLEQNEPERKRFSYLFDKMKREKKSFFKRLFNL